jgi:DNA-binding SARP family transcriptional activator/tetratricopeptide (TPR) repeat protein
MSADPQFHLRLLGGFSLRFSTHAHDVEARDEIFISSKKARALLAYVAMQDAMRISRERLATLLWPDRVDRQARQNLRKCIASLRHDLARHADALLIIDAETVAIRDGLAVDARQLRKLADTDRTTGLEDAAALYRGQFLSDLAMDGEEFRDWVSSERERLDAAAGMILSALASHADQAGDARTALAVSARLTAIDPLREDWLRLSLTIAARHVGRDKALTQAKSFVALLRKELDVEPEAETTALIEQIKAGRIAPSWKRDVLASDLASDMSGASASPDPSEDRGVALPKSAAVANAGGCPPIASAIVAAAVVFLMACLSVAYWPGARTGLPQFASIDAAIDKSTIPLLVLPFRSETAETAQLARALTDNLLASVSRFSGMTVIDGRSTESVRSRSDVRLSTSGSVRQQGSIVRLNVGLNDTAEQTPIWTGDFTANDDRIAKMDIEIPGRIARELQVRATYAAGRDVNGAALNLAASNQLIAKALTIQYRGSTDGAASAVPLYEEVLRRDDSSPLALIGLAAELVTSSANFLSERRSTLARAENLVNRALQINPRIERAYYWLGIIYLGRGQRALALQSFDRALALNPNFIPAEAHAGYALVLMGRTGEGLRRIENALGLGSHDPNERLWLRFLGIAELELGNDAQAIDSLLQAASLAAPTPPLHAAFASAYALTGQHSKSREQFQLVKEMADPVALDQLLRIASRRDGQPGSRHFQGLRLAAGDTL